MVEKASDFFREVILNGVKARIRDVQAHKPLADAATLAILRAGEVPDPLYSNEEFNPVKDPKFIEDQFSKVVKKLDNDQTVINE